MSSTVSGTRYLPEGVSRGRAEGGVYYMPSVGDNLFLFKLHFDRVGRTYHRGGELC
jgi:hypothetical protein